MGGLSAALSVTLLATGTTPLPPPGLLETINLMEQIRLFVPGRESSGTSVSFIQMVLSDPALRARLEASGASFCFWVEGLMRDLDVLKVAYAINNPTSPQMTRAFQVANDTLASLYARHCGGPGGAAATVEWRALGMKLMGLARPGGLVQRAAVGQALLAQPRTPPAPITAGELSPQRVRATGGACDLRTGACPPAPPGGAEGVAIAVGIAIVSGFIPGPDEVVTWPVLLRLAGAAP